MKTVEAGTFFPVSCTDCSDIRAGQRRIRLSAPVWSEGNRRAGTGMNMSAQGERLRKLRKDKSLTLSQLAKRVERSVGYLSQIERGISSPKLKDLVAISVALDVPLATVLPESEGVEAGRPEQSVSQEGSRRRMAAEGITTEALTPTAVPNFDFMRSVIAPGASTLFKQSPNDGSVEFGYIVSGTLELNVNGTKAHLKAGDSYSYRRSSIHNSTNAGTEDTVVIWCVLYSQVSDPTM